MVDTIRFDKKFTCASNNNKKNCIHANNGQNICRHMVVMMAYGCDT